MSKLVLAFALFFTGLSFALARAVNKELLRSSRRVDATLPAFADSNWATMLRCTNACYRTGND